ncbi:phenylacetate--CoA ligase family protein [Arcticibacterium luteifluviistationis]|uniref:Phenylacetate--CoA ligase n=1 Tax=Arcticibacterium luteifluviistationis TaxID=1784714 RepID=A0A2Z4GDC4_9BACT|nr:AMP-binding protein [Arcticibacterium luteifluviistationis]AWV99154.1 phenylacetate--CoA ligase [Arcticibacterium luteifluviistationis]
MIPEIELKSLEEQRAFQERKLPDLLAYLSEKSVYYRELFVEHNIDIKSINSLEALQRIPVTNKEDLQTRNQDFVCVTPREIIDYITTSGTLGDPVTFPLTDKDLERLAYNEYISFACAQGSADDIYQLMTTMDKRFMAGLAYFMGIRKLGAGVVRVGGGIPELQWDTLKRINPTAFVTVPSFLLKLIEYAEANGIDYKATQINKAICIGESLRNEDFTLSTLGEKIKEKWDIKLYSTYASTEMSTAFTECEAGLGGHHHPELVIVEFLDEQNQPVKEGEAGEVVITTLGVEGMPLLRFKTGDICYHYKDACSCGRKTIRLGPIIGRKKQMIKYKGTTLYPPALYDILNDISGIQNYLVEVFTNELGTDEIVVKVGSKDNSPSFEKEIKDHFRAKLRVAPKIKFEDVQLIDKLKNPKLSRKPVLFHDLRTFA